MVPQRRRRAAVIALVLCTFLPPTGRASSSDRKVLRVGVTAPAVSLDPTESLDSVSGLVVAQIFETPYFVAPGASVPQPLLFGAPLRTDGPLVLSAPVRAGVVFSDGTPLTAKIAASSLARVRAVTEKAAVSADGDRVVFRLKTPDAFFETLLSQLLCAITLQRGRQILGTGAYMPWPGSTLNAMVLVPNPRAARPPLIEQVRFSVFRPTSDGNVAGLVNAVKRGEIDFADGIPLAEAQRLEGTPGVTSVIAAGKSTGILFINLEKPGPLQDAKVRRAIALSIDRNEVSKRFFGGTAKFSATSILPPSMGTFDPDGLAYDPAAAQKLLAGAAAQKPIELTLLETWTARPYAPNPTGICRLLAEQLGKSGIHVRVVPSGGTSGYFEKLERGDYEMVLAGWIADTHEPIDFLESNLASWAIPMSGAKCGSCNNVGRLRSKSADAALHAYREHRAASGLASILRIAGEDVPFVPLVHGPSVTVLSTKVKGFRPSPLAYTVFSRLELEEK